MEEEENNDYSLIEYKNCNILKIEPGSLQVEKWRMFSQKD
jgi:hypothetical protein